jgi:hypothetical protein
VLQWTVTYSGLTGPAGMAHFHCPAPAGKYAAAVMPIDMSKLLSPIEGETTLTALQESDLLGRN